MRTKSICDRTELDFQGHFSDRLLVIVDGAEDFVKGCGVFCDPSYLLDFTEEMEEGAKGSPFPLK